MKAETIIKALSILVKYEELDGSFIEIQCSGHRIHFKMYNPDKDNDRKERNAIKNRISPNILSKHHDSNGKNDLEVITSLGLRWEEKYLTYSSF